MDSDLRQQMLAYYDARAPEYEEAYTLGTGTASIRDPEVFKAEAQVLAGIVAGIARGRMLDLACGTAYWLPQCGPKCSSVTLFDQSAAMLAEAREKSRRYDLVDRCTFVQGDFFEHVFAAGAYDTALVGFFMSHLTEDQESLLFDALRTLLDASGRFLILDSVWSAERAAVNAKIERQTRRVNGGSAFEIYKRYLDRSDVARWTRTRGISLRVEHFGSAFCAVSGTFGSSADMSLPSGV